MTKGTNDFPSLRIKSPHLSKRELMLRGNMVPYRKGKEEGKPCTMPDYFLRGCQESSTGEAKGCPDTYRGPILIPCEEGLKLAATWRGASKGRSSVSLEVGTNWPPLYWVNSGSWWWTGRPGMLQFMGSQRVGHDWATELNWTDTLETWKSIEVLHPGGAHGQHLSFGDGQT